MPPISFACSQYTAGITISGGSVGTVATGVNNATQSIAAEIEKS